MCRFWGCAHRDISGNRHRLNTSNKCQHHHQQVAECLKGGILYGVHVHLGWRSSIKKGEMIIGYRTESQNRYWFFMCHLLFSFQTCIKHTCCNCKCLDALSNRGRNCDFSSLSKKTVLPADFTLFRPNVHMTPLLCDLQISEEGAT